MRINNYIKKIIFYGILTILLLFRIEHEKLKRCGNNNRNKCTKNENDNNNNYHYCYHHNYYCNNFGKNNEFMNAIKLALGIAVVIVIVKTTVIKKE